jgi:hypothetical protein
MTASGSHDFTGEIGAAIDERRCAGAGAAAIAAIAAILMLQTIIVMLDTSSR